MRTIRQGRYQGVPNLSRVSISFDEDTFAIMRDIAAAKQVSFGAVVREAVRRGLISAGRLPDTRRRGED